MHCRGGGRRASCRHGDIDCMHVIINYMFTQLIRISIQICVNGAYVSLSRRRPSVQLETDRPGIEANVSHTLIRVMYDTILIVAIHLRSFL